MALNAYILFKFLNLPEFVLILRNPNQRPEYAKVNQPSIC